MLKTLVASSALALASFLGTVPSAEARHWDYCLPVDGGTLCANYGSYSDYVEVSTDSVQETFTSVRCTASNWSYTSNGSLTKAQASYFVRNYCKGRLGS